MKNTLIYISNYGSDLKPYNKEVLSTAQSIAEKNNLTNFIAGFNLSEELISKISKYSGGKVINIKIQPELISDYAYEAQILEKIINDNDIDLILVPSEKREIAPRLAKKSKALFIADVMDIEAKSEKLFTTKTIYSGKATLKEEIIATKCVLTLRNKMFEIIEGTYQNEIIDYIPDITYTPKVKVLEKTAGSQKLNITEADKIVSAGRGIKSPENHKIIQELADKIGAAVGASRAIVDCGWRPHIEQIGQTGKVVTPNLYIACGISGAVQHLAGMNNSKIILAVNSDKDAPIFNYCDYGIIGDLNEVLPKIMELI